MKTRSAKILFITGSYPPDVCGVGDYISVLYNELKRQNSKFEFEVFFKQQWSLNFLWSYLKQIKAHNADVIHMQYPTEGYGYSFLPFLLLLFLRPYPIVLTLHELSNRTFKAKLFTYMLVLFSNYVIFTNTTEKKYLKSIFIFKHKKTTVINIGSNIPAINDHNNFNPKNNDLIYFGHIRPLKGLETFLEVVKGLKTAGCEIKCVIIGQTLGKYDDFAKYVRQESKLLGIKIITNLSKEDTAKTLSDSKIAYLPYPDGISARRGSLLAAIINNCTIVSTISKEPDINTFFEPYCYLTKTSQEAIDTISGLANNKVIEKNGEKLSDVFSWNSIAKAHITFYCNVICKNLLN
jgi:glycosyltransferase involved in cell wall biosynthesis